MSHDFESRLRELDRLRAEKDRTAREAEEAKEQFQRYQTILFEDMNDAGFTGFTTPDAQYVAKGTIYSSVKDFDAFMKWATDNGLAEEFSELSPAKGRLNELVRQCLEDGQDIPPGLDWYRKTYISRTAK